MNRLSDVVIDPEGMAVFEFTETILVRAPRPAVWAVMSDLDRWWTASNPEHESLERLDDRGIEVGARLRVREKIAGVPGEYTGSLTQVIPPALVTMEAPAARYRLLGVGLTVAEGVTWSLDVVDEDTTRVSARVWANFGSSLVGRMTEWVFTHILDGVAKDREHARTELCYLKNLLELPDA